MLEEVYVQSYIRIGVAALCCAPVFAFTATNDQAAVHIQYSSTDSNILIVEGLTYTLHLDCEKAMITRFAARDEELIGAEPLMAMMSTGKVNGPGRLEIRRFGPHMAEIRLRDLQWNNLDADIQLVLYCYGKRVYCNLVVDQRQAPQKFWMGWYGDVRHGTTLPYSAAELDKYLDFGATRPKSIALLLPVAAQGGARQRAYLRLRPLQRLLARYEFTEADFGTRTTVIVLAAGESHEDLRQLVQTESASEKIGIDCRGGTFRGFQRRAGYFLIEAESTSDLFIKATVSSKETILTGPAEIVCCVESKSENWAGAVLADGNGFVLPVPVQLSRVFTLPSVGANGRTVDEAIFPLPVQPELPGQAQVRLLGAASRGRKVRQLASVESNDPVLQTTLGGIETFRYHWLGHTGTIGEGVAEFNSDRAIHGGLQYQSGGNVINTRLERVRLFMTGPNLANFAIDTVSEEGKIDSSIEVTETTHDDHPRAFIKLQLQVRETVELDDSSARSLRILGTRPDAPNRIWDRLAYTGESGEAISIDLRDRDGWILEAAPLGAEYPFVTVYATDGGGISYFINRIEGTVGARSLSSLGLSCARDEHGIQIFLTTPSALKRLEKGDRLEAHLFLMSHTDANPGTAEIQRDLFGKRIPRIDVEHGTPLPGFPRRLRCDPRGFAHFTLRGGHNWTPVLIEGFASHIGPMLWEKRGKVWRCIEYEDIGHIQSYRDQAGLIGFVPVLNLQPGESRELFFSTAANARRIETNGETVKIEGGPLEFISPVTFHGLDSTPVQGTAFYKCKGPAGIVTSE